MRTVRQGLYKSRWLLVSPPRRPSSNPLGLYPGCAQGRYYRRTFFPNFPDFPGFSPEILLILFLKLPDLLPKRGMLRVPEFLLSVIFPVLGNVSCFLLFLLKKKRKIRKKSFDTSGLSTAGAYILGVRWGIKGIKCYVRVATIFL